jgi:hypothetical protein
VRTNAANRQHLADIAQLAAVVTAGGDVAAAMQKSGTAIQNRTFARLTSK